MEQEIKSHVEYDDRRKVLTQHFESVQDIKVGDKVVGQTTMKREATFNEEGIRNIWEDLANQRMKFEQTIKKIKSNIKNAGKLTPELKELEEKIKAINDFNTAEQMKSQIETNEEDLKKVKKDIRDIKEAIGSRLKL